MSNCKCFSSVQHFQFSDPEYLSLYDMILLAHFTPPLTPSSFTYSLSTYLCSSHIPLLSFVALPSTVKILRRTQKLAKTPITVSGSCSFLSPVLLLRCVSRRSYSSWFSLPSHTNDDFIFGCVYVDKLASSIYDSFGGNCTAYEML